MASFTGSQSTQPFSDASQPVANLQQLISDLPPTIDLSFVRIFARCCLNKRYLFMSTYPDGAQAANLGHGILGVSQSTRSTGCDIQIPSLGDHIMGAHLRFFFDPARDSITVQNMSGANGQGATTVTLQSASWPTNSCQLTAAQYTDLEPGAWTISTCPPAGTYGPPEDLADLDLRPRRALSASSLDAASGPADRAGSKRSRDKDTLSLKKQKTASGKRQIFTSTAAHPLIELSDGETVHIEGQRRDDNYWLTREKHLTTTGSAVLYKARYSRRPDQIILAKALKGGESARSTAEQWRREVLAHGGIGKHASYNHAAGSQVLINNADQDIQPSIATLFGSDARYFTLYMELVDSPSLVHARDASKKCTCPDAAFTILSDLASALQFIHTAGLVHNDIKPANIIYHNTRGAILIDFGLGGPATETVHGGTPWYLPPEYLTRLRRGPPSDVFALGVTLLWVLRKCELPEQLELWQIRDVHQGRSEAGARARHTMRSWLEKVEEVRTTLSESQESIENVVRRMLRKTNRDTAEDVLKNLGLVVL